MRPFTVVDVEQRSAEWFAARLGRVTGTAAGPMLSKGKGSAESVGRRDLRIRLALERLTGNSQDDGGFQTADMKRGVELEPDALAAYEVAYGAAVSKVGFVQHADLMVGHSPDGIIGDFDGLLELKCPKSATHYDYLREGALPSAYLAQVTHGLYITGAKYCDFVSFDPRFPPALQLFRYRVELAPETLAAYELALKLFLSEVEREVADISKLADAA